MKRIIFGMPTLLELDTLDQCIQLAQKLNLGFIELNMNLPQYQPDRIDTELLLESRKKGMQFTFHLDERFDPAAFNAKVGEAYQDTLIDTIALAKATGVPLINIHLSQGVYFMLPEEKVYLYDRYQEHFQMKLQLLRERCEEAVGNSEIRICVENTEGFFPFMQKGVSMLLQSDIFGLTLDVGHAHTAQRDDMPFFAQNAQKLWHMHLHDAKRNRCHLALGAGELPIEDKLELARQAGCRCVVETKSVSGLIRSIERLTSYTYG